MTSSPLSPKSTNKLREALFNEMADGVIMVDTQGTIIDCNPAFHQKFGYEKAELIGRSIKTLCTNEFAAKAPERITQFDSQDQITYETAYHHKDGTVIPVELNARLFESAGTTLFFSIVRDISNRKRAESELRQAHAELESRVHEKTEQHEHASRQLRASEERFRDIAAATSDWFWETGPDHKISYLTDSYFAITGIDPATVIGKSRLELAPDEDDMTKWDAHLVALENRHTFRSLQYEIVRPDGTSLPVSISGKPVFNDACEFLGYRGTGTNLTERRISERKLIETANELKGVLESTSQGYWRIDTNAITIEVNPRMAEIIGVSQSEAVGTSVYDYLSAEQQDLHKTKIKRRPVGISEAYELEITSATGNLVPCLFNATPFHDATGNVAGSFALVSDISDLKKTQFTLEKSMLEAKAANKVKSDLMANMSHELRTPLNAIIGFSSTIQAEIFGPVGHDKYREYLSDIQYSGQHLLELINDILDVSAIEAGALDLHEEDVSLSSIVDASVRIIKPRADTGQVRVVSTMDPKLPLIHMDERRGKQIILNLLSNAVKFTPEGGDVFVTSSLNTHGSVSVSVRDTGIGMDKDELEKALSAFGQVDSGLNRKHEGTGLGLPLTKGLIELHGGILDVKSDKGLGTQITVTFPTERVVQDAN